MILRSGVWNGGTERGRRGARGVVMREDVVS